MDCLPTSTFDAEIVKVVVYVVFGGLIAQ